MDSGDKSLIGSSVGANDKGKGEKEARLSVKERRVE